MNKTVSLFLKTMYEIQNIYFESKICYILLNIKVTHRLKIKVMTFFYTVEQSFDNVENHMLNKVSKQIYLNITSNCPECSTFGTKSCHNSSNARYICDCLEPYCGKFCKRVNCNSFNHCNLNGVLLEYEGKKTCICKQFIQGKHCKENPQFINFTKATFKAKKLVRFSLGVYYDFPKGFEVASSYYASGQNLITSIIRHTVSNRKKILIHYSTNFNSFSGQFVQIRKCIVSATFLQFVILVTFSTEKRHTESVLVFLEIPAQTFAK